MKKTSSIQVVNIRSRARAMGVLDGALWLAALTLVVTSAIWTKTTGALPALVGLEQTNQVVAQVDEAPVQNVVLDPELPIVEVVDAQQVQVEEPVTEEPIVEVPVVEEPIIDPSYRYFDGKLVRPARVMYMTVTGYSPDARSCGEFADGKTAIMKSVWTNGMKLVAADPTVLPYWSMVSVPGYAGSEIVPVLDCGGAIKGSRLDLLYPTHKMARKWGVRQVPVTVWEYVDEP